VTLPITTERLVIREYAREDAPDVARVLGDPLLSLGKDEAPMTFAEASAWLEEEMQHRRRDGTGRYAIVLRETGEVVGGCGLVRRELPEGVEFELGYHLRGDLWGAGLATEAARACLDEARERGYARVIAFIEPGNTRSERVALKAGMLPEREREWFGSGHVQWAADLRATIDNPDHDREE
jgi:[ribosomal protein S5]-alanine N-acetyltransferase